MSVEFLQNSFVDSKPLLRFVPSFLHFSSSADPRSSGLRIFRPSWLPRLGTCLKATCRKRGGLRYLTDFSAYRDTFDRCVAPRADDSLFACRSGRMDDAG